VCDQLDAPDESGAGVGREDEEKYAAERDIRSSKKAAKQHPAMHRPRQDEEHGNRC